MRANLCIQLLHFNPDCFNIENERFKTGTSVINRYNKTLAEVATPSGPS